MLVLLAAFTLSAHAQWAIQDAHTTADLRGIDNVGGGVAWASGTNGTVLRTEDAGFVWQLCATPPGAEKLDFRGIQAFDNNTAIVMSSGKGDLSRLYKTTDGCQTWKLVFTNPDVDGFWDAIHLTDRMGLLVGDPVGGRFAIFSSVDGNLQTWSRFGELSDFRHFRFEPSPYAGEALFAASNSNVKGSPKTGIGFVTGGPLGAKFAYGVWSDGRNGGYPAAEFRKVAIPLASGTSGGAFSLDCAVGSTSGYNQRCVAVGGDYQSPAGAGGTAAYSYDSGRKWIASKLPPHGYRSAVAYEAATKTWVTVGPNGTDVSTDDGRNWRALRPLAGEAADTDQHWNALSLPFVVGPKGRIGVLETAALKAK
jgi:photosystem II stability/assembly factor-like uncharacterized protein